MLNIKEFFDQDTSTLSYVVSKGDACIVLDPVHNLDVAGGKVSEKSHSDLLAYLKQNKLSPQYCFETHVHADHITGAQLLKREFPDIKIAISDRIRVVQEVFNELLDLNSDTSHFDFLLKDHESYRIEKGSDFFDIKILPTPGHTPACTSFLIENVVFVGDLIFIPDFGTGRCDFPKGSAQDLYDSITKIIYSLPDETLIYVGHDYQPNGRELRCFTTVKEQKSSNIHLPKSRSKGEFVEMRQARDKTLPAPKLLFPSLQANVYAGNLPNSDTKGRRFFKLPIFLKR